MTPQEQTDQHISRRLDALEAAAGMVAQGPLGFIRTVPDPDGAILPARVVAAYGPWDRLLGLHPHELLEENGQRMFRHLVTEDAEVTAATAAAIHDGIGSVEVAGFTNRYRHRNGRVSRVQWWTWTEDTGATVGVALFMDLDK